MKCLRRAISSAVDVFSITSMSFPRALVISSRSSRSFCSSEGAQRGGPQRIAQAPD